MLFEFLNDLSEKKKDLSKEDSFSKEYNPYLINLFLTSSPDCLYAVDEMNYHWQLPKKVQYRCLLNNIKRKKRFFTWKKKKEDDVIEMISAYYGISKREARIIRTLHTDEQLEKIERSLDKGGMRKDG